MKKLILLTLAIVCLSCSEDSLENTPENSFGPEFIINSETASLASRVSRSNAPAMDGLGVSYTKIAEVAPNEINGYGLSATGVTRLNDKVYVTYHVRGEVYGGEILTFDVSDPSNPQLIHSLVDETADYNDIMMGQGKVNVWVAGARDIYASGYQNTNGAIATKIRLNGQKLPSNDATWELPLTSYSASSITRVDPPRGSSGGRIFVTTGSSGGLTVVRGNDEEDILHARQVNNAKHFDYDNDKGVFLRGIDASSSEVDVYALDDSFGYNTYTIPYDVTFLGKNGIDVEGDFAYMALGDDGLVKMNITTGQIENTFHSGGNGDANAVFVDDDLIYLANGSDGLIILNKSDLSFVTSYKFDGSCNYVEVEDDLVFVANGSSGGLIILEKQ